MSPLATEAAKAWSWWRKGELGLLYPLGLPTVVEEAVGACDAAYAEWRHVGDEMRRPPEKR